VRRALPPLSSLRHFEAAARLESFKDAAAELNLTQGAVSQQIAELERFLGVDLFERSRRRVVLTEDGKRFAEAVQHALDEIAAAALIIRDRTDTKSVRVEVGPFFSARWLAPRLTRFMQRHPEVELNLVHTVGRRLGAGEVDVSIRWGDGHWPNFSSERLLEVELQPVAARSLRTTAGTAKDIAKVAHLLLHTQDRSAWSDWLAGAELPEEIATEGTVFDEPNVAVEAAAAGRGIGMGYFPLTEEDTRSGRLICLYTVRVPARNAYYLLRSARGRHSTSVRVFIDWLRSEIDRDRTRQDGR
jgi:LysR family transcriptional regulator, glycine cleavage system transcriptional activator